MIISNIPATTSEFRPNHVSPILCPSCTPTIIDRTEKIPTDSDAGKGETPVIPAPNPMDKQFRASMNPRIIASFQSIATKFLFTVCCDIKILLRTSQAPITINKDPPIIFATAKESVSASKPPTDIERNAKIVDINEMTILYFNGIRLKRNPYEMLIPTLSKFATMPINKIVMINI